MTQSEKRLFLIQSLLKERPEYRQVETPRDPEGQRQLLRGLMNVRPPQAADPDFLRVQDAYLQAERYENFLRTRQGQKLLFLELGVGYNTPVIIKYPFWRMTAANPRATYACLDLGQAAGGWWVNTISRPVSGWVKPSRQAHRARASPSPAPPYFRSPTRGKPRPANCTRIWWVRPVCRVTRTRDSPSRTASVS